MTGRIKSLGDGGAFGLILTENGLSVHFDLTAVLAYDVACLAVGQTVSFELEGRNHPKAMNVCVQKPHPALHALAKLPESNHLRYTGFEQDGNIRAYRFERIATGEETRAFLVTADLSLFRKHQVGIQEGPHLCLHVLTMDLNSADSLRHTPPRRALTDLDMLAHVASRPVHGSRARRKGPPRPLAAAHAV